MKKIALSILPVVFLISWPIAFAQTAVAKGFRKVTIIVFVDNSKSMEIYKPRVRQLVASLAAALKKTNCMEINIGVVAEGNYQAARLNKGSQDPFVYGGGSNERYLDLNDEANLTIFAKRISQLPDGGGHESTVEHVFYTATFDRSYLLNRDLLVAIVISDVAMGADTPRVPGIEFVSNIQLLLGQTRFLALGIGIDTREEVLNCPADVPLECRTILQRHFGANNVEIVDGGILMPNKSLPFAKAMNICSEEMGFASPRLLQDFSRGSGGRFINICNSSYLPAVESFTDRIFRAAKCNLLM